MVQVDRSDRRALALTGNAARVVRDPPVRITYRRGSDIAEFLDPVGTQTGRCDVGTIVVQEKRACSRGHRIVDHGAAVTRIPRNEEVIGNHGEYALGFQILRNLMRVRATRVQVPRDRIIDRAAEARTTGGGFHEWLDLGDPARLLVLAGARQPQIVRVQLAQRDAGYQTGRFWRRLRNDPGQQVLHRVCRIALGRVRGDRLDTSILRASSGHPAGQDNH